MLSFLRFFLCYVSANTVPFPIESCTFTPQNGGKVTPDVTSTLISAKASIPIIGASLSEPHTYRTAVQNPPYVYIYIRVVRRTVRLSGVQFGPANGPFKRAMRKRRTGQ